GLAALQVSQHFARRFHEELIAEIRVQLPPHPFTLLGVKIKHIHADSPWPAPFPRCLIPNDRATSANSARKSFLPRLNLDMTVPNGILMVSAISRYENSSTSAMRTVSRNSIGTLARASRTSSSRMSCGTGGSAIKLSSPPGLANASTREALINRRLTWWSR